MVIDFIFFFNFFSFTCKLASRGYYAFHKLSFKRQKNVLNLANSPLKHAGFDNEQVISYLISESEVVT